MKFSTELKDYNLNTKFIEWLCGFIDGGPREGKFYINKKTNTNFSFRFEIHLIKMIYFF
jgi:hypothetical protein